MRNRHSANCIGGGEGSDLHSLMSGLEIKHAFTVSGQNGSPFAYHKPMVAGQTESPAYVPVITTTEFRQASRCRSSCTHSRLLGT